MRGWHLVFGLWLATAAAAVAAEPFARVTVETDGTILPGQQVLLSVVVLVPDFFTSPPQFPLFDLPDAIVTLPDEQALNRVERIDGVQYSGIRRTYAVIPEASGTFAVPPVKIPLGYSRDGTPVAGEVSLPPTRFEVGEPSGGATTSLIFTASAVTITQSFDRDPSNLKVGDALVRTVTIFAKDTQAIMMPAVSVEKPEGMTVYALAPKFESQVQAADRTTGSTRTETITYIAQAAGRWEIPAISYPWFDIDTHQSTRASIAATTVIAAAAPRTSADIAPAIEDQDAGIARQAFSTKTHLFLALGIAVLSLIAWFLRRVHPLAQAWWSSYQNGDRQTQRRRLAALQHSVREDDAITIYRNLEAWTASLGFKSIAGWVLAMHDKDVEHQVGLLERMLFDPLADGLIVDRSGFARMINDRKFRVHPEAQPNTSCLPALNPRPTAVRSLSHSDGYGRGSHLRPH